MTANRWHTLAISILVLAGLVLYARFFERRNEIPVVVPSQITKIPIVTSSVIKDTIKEKILKDIVHEGVPCTATDESGMTKNGCRVDKVVDNFAKGVVPMAYWIALKTDDTWKVIITGNGIPSCKEINTYAVPKEIYGNCIETSGTLRF